MEMFETTTGKTVATIQVSEEHKDNEGYLEFVEWLLGIMFGKNNVAIDRSKKGD